MSKQTIFMCFLVLISVGFYAYTLHSKEVQRQEQARLAAVKQMCIERADKKANEFQVDEGLKANPFLPGIAEQAPQIRQQIRNKEFVECMDIWAK